VGLALAVRCTPFSASVASTAAGPDGGPDATGGASWPCGSPFCDDFERDSVPHGDWTLDVSGGEIEIDPTQSYITPHRSLRAHVGLGGGATPRRALLSSPYQNAKHVRCSFSLLVNDPGPTANTIDLFVVNAMGGNRPNPSSMRFGTSGNLFQVRQDVSLVDGGCECPTKNVYFGSVTPDAGRSRWRAVTLDTTLTQTTVTVDDFNQTYPFEVFPFDRAQLEIGIVDFGDDTADFNIDDLACEID
jgi:hypothetical protein